VKQLYLCGQQIFLEEYFFILSCDKYGYWHGSPQSGRQLTLQEWLY